MLYEKKKLLEVKNLSCKRNYKLIFKNISFSLEPGGVIFINGNNGSGKTSLLLALSGILQCEGIKKMSQDQIGYVGHKNALNETETVREYLYFWKNIFSYKYDYNHIVKYFQLKSLLDMQISMLSFGQKKKLSFSRLKMTNTQLWLLDEPVSGLDQKTKLLILKLINQHTENGGGVIITSHQNLNLHKIKNIKRVNID